MFSVRGWSIEAARVHRDPRSWRHLRATQQEEKRYSERGAWNRDFLSKAK